MSELPGQQENRTPLTQDWDCTADIGFDGPGIAMVRVVETPFLCVDLARFRRGDQWRREKAATTTVVQVLEGRVAVTRGQSTVNKRAGQGMTVPPGEEWAATALARAILQIIRSPHPDFADLLDRSSSTLGGEA
jgi:quercetin dioxygenase-like cupin family protein